MMQTGRPENPNLYGLSDTDHAGDCSDTTGKQRIFPALGGSTAIFVTIGQSRIANNSAAPATPYVPTHGSAVINLNPYDGFYYVGKDPFVGCSASAGYLLTGWHGRLADKLITAAKYTQVVFIPCAIAGSSVTEWMPGAAFADRIRAVSAMLTAKSLTPTAWLWQQGTTDNINGMDQATYQTDLRAVIAYQRSLSGRSGDKWVISRDTISGAVTSAPIRAACVAVAADSNNILGPDCDTIPGVDFDGTHYNDTGNDFIAGLWSTNIQANL